MPVDLTDHEPLPVRPGTNEAEALSFLYENPDYGFTPAEVRDATAIPEGSTHKALARLREKGLIGQTSDGFYHALDDARVATFATGLRDGISSNNEDANDDPDTHEAAETSGDSDAHRRAARAFFRRVRDHLGDAITDLYLFGSVARADATPASDVDVLAVVAPEADYAAVDDALLEIAYDVQLDHAVRIEVHALREPEFAARKESNDPFVRTVLAEGEAVD